MIYPLTIILRMRDLNAYEEFITGFSVSPLLDLLTTTAKETISKILELGNDDSAELEKSINKMLIKTSAIQLAMYSCSGLRYHRNPGKN